MAFSARAKIRALRSLALLIETVVGTALLLIPHFHFAGLVDLSALPQVPPDLPAVTALVAAAWDSDWMLRREAERSLGRLRVAPISTKDWVRVRGLLKDEEPVTAESFGRAVKRAQTEQRGRILRR